MDRVNQLFQRVRSTKAIGTTLSGQYDFEIRTSSDRITIPNETFILVEGDITPADGTFNFSCANRGATYADPDVSAPGQKDGFANNPLSTFFVRSELFVNNQSVSVVNEFPSTSTALKFCYNSYDEELDSMSPCTPVEWTLLNSSYSSLSTNVFVNPKPILTGGHITQTADAFYQSNERNKMISPTYTRSDDLTAVPNLHVIMALPIHHLVKMDGDIVIPPSSYLKLSYTIDSNFEDRLCFRTTGSDKIVFTPTNMMVMLSQYKTSIPVSLNYSGDYLGIVSHRRTNFFGTQQFTLSPSIETVIISFPKAFEHQFNYRANDFGGVFSQPDPGTNTLSYIGISYGGKSYPDESRYDLISDTGRFQAYLDYKTNTMQLNNKAMLTYRQWLYSPIFVFHVQSDSTNSDNILVVNNGSVGSAITDFSFFVMGMHKKNLSIQYDGYAQPISTSVSDII